MQRLTAWLCLLIVLANPMVTQARVAYGLAKSLSEAGRDVLESSQEDEDEEYDGSDITAVTAANVRGVFDSSLSLSAHFELLAAIPALCSSVDLGFVLRSEGRVYRPPPTVRERLASLQSFLI